MDKAFFCMYFSILFGLLFHRPSIWSKTLLKGWDSRVTTSSAIVILMFFTNKILSFLIVIFAGRQNNLCCICMFSLTPFFYNTFLTLCLPSFYVSSLINLLGKYTTTGVLCTYMHKLYDWVGSLLVLINGFWLKIFELILKSNSDVTRYKT